TFLSARVDFGCGPQAQLSCSCVSSLKGPGSWSTSSIDAAERAVGCVTDDAGPNAAEDATEQGSPDNESRACTTAIRSLVNAHSTFSANSRRSASRALRLFTHLASLRWYPQTHEPGRCSSRARGPLPAESSFEWGVRHSPGPTQLPNLSSTSP